MTLDNDGHANPHAPRYPSDLPPRRDGTSPAAASPRKRLAMARAILSALDAAGALAVLLALRRCHGGRARARRRGEVMRRAVAAR